MITRSRSYLNPDGSPSALLVAHCIREFAHDVRPHVERDIRYYRGQHDILEKSGRYMQPNNQLVHPFPAYIATIASGYLLGKPVEYGADDAEAIETLNAVYSYTDMDSEDAEMARDAAVCGRGVEILYTDEQSRPRAAALDPQNAFVVYDDTVEHKKLFGVHYYDILDIAGKKTRVRVRVFTGTQILEWESASTDISGAPHAVEYHMFGSVPMVEFWNDEDEQGDFSQVITLIDAYNTLQSERINDKQNYANSILLLYGVSIEPEYEIDPETGLPATDESGNPIVRRTVSQRIAEDRILQIPADKGDASVEYLSRAMDENNVDILRNALNSDIHKLALVPDMSDENFAGNSSGVAMRYKLLAFEQKTRIKERWFKQALRERLELIENLLAFQAEKTLDPHEVSITMTRSLPVNENEIAGMISTLDGIVSRATLLAQLPFVDDPQVEIDLTEEAEEKKAERQARAFGEPPFPRPSADDDDETDEESRFPAAAGKYPAKQGDGEPR